MIGREIYQLPVAIFNKSCTFIQMILNKAKAVIHTINLELHKLKNEKQRLPTLEQM